MKPGCRAVSTLAIFLTLSFLGGCAGSGWGARTGLPESFGAIRQSVGEAARKAVVQPSVWAPLGGALILGIADLDDNVSDWAVRKQPLFGSNAADVSDDLLTASLGVWALSTLAAPADGVGDKLAGAAVQAGTIVLVGGMTEGLKGVTGRRRPNDQNNNSFPSGHASQAAVRTHWARTNLSYMEMPEKARMASNLALHTLGYATAWARVEAERHYPSDVLAGVAIGNFVAEFMRGLLFAGKPEVAAGLQIQAVPGGAMLTFSQQLR